MKLKTVLLDRAAYLMCYGAELIKLEGKYPENKFILEGPEWLKELEKNVKMVDYKKFCEMRRVIKRRSRLRAGLPAHFTGESKGFKFMDIAHVKSVPNSKV